MDQAYHYAINLPCDWIIVTSMRETRLYYKGAHQQAYERFETVRLAADEALLKRFVFLLGAERVVPAHRDCHLYELLRASETVGRALTNQFYALYADIRQRVLARLCRENATVAPPEILRCTQKLLDRVLFCAFCEDRGLLPAKSLKSAFEHHDPYNPKPVWLNFRGLFRAIDEGNAGLNIPAYNGGLFALDSALDALQVPDEVCAYFKDLGDYDYRPTREVADADEDRLANRPERPSRRYRFLSRAQVPGRLSLRRSSKHPRRFLALGFGICINRLHGNQSPLTRKSIFRTSQIA